MTFEIDYSIHHFLGWGRFRWDIFSDLKSDYSDSAFHAHWIHQMNLQGQASNHLVIMIYYRLGKMHPKYLHDFCNGQTE